MIVAAFAGPTLAADDSGRSAPEAAVSAVGDEGTSSPAEPAQDVVPVVPAGEDGERVQPEVETEAVEDGDEAEGAEKRGDGRGSKRQDDARDKKEPRAKVSVTIEDFEFKPKTINIEPGDEITWTNKDTAQHDATGEGSADFSTGLLETGEKATVPINETGTLNYFCSVHPDMTAKIVSSSGDSGGDGDTGGTGSSGSNFDSSTGSTFPSSTGSDFGSTGSTGGGSLPNTGQPELPLLLLGMGLIVFGLLARAFHEYWIWR